MQHMYHIRLREGLEKRVGRGRSVVLEGWLSKGRSGDLRGVAGGQPCSFFGEQLGGETEGMIDMFCS